MALGPSSPSALETASLVLTPLPKSATHELSALLNELEPTSLTRLLSALASPLLFDALEPPLQRDGGARQVSVSATRACTALSWSAVRCIPSWRLRQMSAASFSPESEETILPPGCASFEEASSGTTEDASSANLTRCPARRASSNELGGLRSCGDAGERTSGAAEDASSANLAQRPTRSAASIELGGPRSRGDARERCSDAAGEASSANRTRRPARGAALIKLGDIRGRGDDSERSNDAVEDASSANMKRRPALGAASIKFGKIRGRDDDGKRPNQLDEIARREPAKDETGSPRVAAPPYLECEKKQRSLSNVHFLRW